jgi:hypothetical protein
VKIAPAIAREGSPAGLHASRDYLYPTAKMSDVDIDGNIRRMKQVSDTGEVLESFRIAK